MRRFIAALVAVVSTGLPLTLHADRAQQAPEGFPAAGAPPILKVLSTGAEPRIPLTYKVAAGTTSKADVITQMAMKIAMAGMEMPEMPMPAVKMAMEVAVDAVAPNGDMTVRASVKPSMDLSSVPPEMAAAMGGADMASAAMTSTGTMTARGAMRGAKFTGPGADNPQLKQILDQAQSSMGQVVSELPDVPLGVGAKWEVRSRTSTQGFEAYATTTSEVVAIAGRTVTLKITSTMTAPAQVMNNPLLPPGAEISLTKMTGAGGGTATVDLDHLMSQGTLDMTMNMDVTMNMQGTAQAMSMAMSLKTTITPVK